VLFEESRGCSFKVSQIRGISSFTLFGLLNLAAVTYWIPLLGGPRIPDWIAEHGWTVGAVTIGLVGIHWALGRNLRESPEFQTRSAPESKSGSTGKYLWAWYIGATLSFWVLTMAGVLAHMAR
jgi:hypothetical protein